MEKENRFLPVIGRMLFIMIFASAACIFLNNLITLSGISNYFDSVKEVNRSLFDEPLHRQLLTMGVVAPLAEELIFRSLLYGWLRKHMGFAAAAVGSSLLFAVYHMNPVQGLYAFFLGLLLASVYEKTGGFPASVWFHACANVTSIFFTALSAGALITIGGGSFMLLTAGAGIVMSWCLLQYH